MPLEEIDVIDMITKRGSDGRYGLIITDEGLTTAPAERLELLRRKLLTYREALANGQLAETCVGALPEDFFVQVICELPPTPAMRDITHLVTKGLTPAEIPVVFTPFPESSWPAGEVEAAVTGPMTAGMSPEMEQAVKAAFEAAALWLADDRIPLFVYWRDGEQATLAAITESGEREEVIARVTAWASRLGNSAHLCIQMSAAKTAPGPLPVDVLVAQCGERGEREGFILTQDVGQDARTGNLEPRGKIRFIESCANFFPVD